MNTEFENMKYNYILNNYNNQDMQTYQYLVELKEQGYRDVGTLYENLYQWRAILTANMLRDDYMTDENYFKVGDIFYFHVILEGGYPGEEITLKAIVSDSEKTSEWKFYNNLIWKGGFYDTLWGMQCESTDVGEPVTVRIMNGNYVIGEKTIYTMP